MSLYAVIGDNHYIFEIKEEGQVIVLDDNSHWKVAPQFVKETAMWLPLSEITIQKSNNPDFPYRLLNTASSTEAEANFFDELLI